MVRSPEWRTAVPKAISSNSHAGVDHSSHSSSSRQDTNAAQFNDIMSSGSRPQSATGSQSSANESTRQTPTQVFGNNPTPHVMNPESPLTWGNASGGGQQSLPQSRPGTVVNGDQSQISYHVAPMEDGTTQLRPGIAPGNPPGGTGSAYYVPYQNGGQSNTVSVPLHPTSNDPHMVLTPGLTGCTFHGQPSNDGSMHFTHTSGTSATPGTPGRPAWSPQVPAGATGTDYSQYGGGRVPDGKIPNSFAMAHYNDQQGQWNLLEQRQHMDFLGNFSVTGGKETPIL